MTRVRSWEWALLSHQQSLEMKPSLIQEATGQEETEFSFLVGKGGEAGEGHSPGRGLYQLSELFLMQLGSHLIRSGNKGLLRGGQPVQLREVEKGLQGNREASFPLLFGSRHDPHLYLDLSTTSFQLCFLRDETSSLSQLPLGGKWKSQGRALIGPTRVTLTHSGPITAAGGMRYHPRGHMSLCGQENRCDEGGIAKR